MTCNDAWLVGTTSNARRLAADWRDELHSASSEHRRGVCKRLYLQMVQWQADRRMWTSTAGLGSRRFKRRNTGELTLHQEPNNRHCAQFASRASRGRLWRGCCYVPTYIGALERITTSRMTQALNRSLFEGAQHLGESSTVAEISGILLEILLKPAEDLCLPMPHLSNRRRRVPPSNKPRGIRPEWKRSQLRSHESSIRLLGSPEALAEP